MDQGDGIFPRIVNSSMASEEMREVALNAVINEAMNLWLDDSFYIELAMEDRFGGQWEVWENVKSLQELQINSRWGH